MTARPRPCTTFTAQRRGRGRAGGPPAPARRAARGARHHLAQGRLLAVGPVRLLHRARRRQGGRVAASSRSTKVEGKSVTTLEGFDRRRADPLRRRVRGLRRPAVRLLHPRHRRAGQGPGRQEGCRPHPRGHGPPPRRPPLPLHRLREGPRRHRGRRRRQGAGAGAAGRHRHERRPVRGGGPHAGRSGLRRRPPRARAAPRRAPPDRPRPRRHPPHRRRGGACRARRRRRLHGGGHPRRAAGRHHPHRLADHDPRGRAHLLRRRRPRHRRRRDPAAGPRRGRPGRRRRTTCCGR